MARKFDRSTGWASLPAAAWWGGLLLIGAQAPVAAADRLLFCNQPERILRSGAYADAALEPGLTYRVFFHYRNTSSRTGPLVIAIHDTSGAKRLTVAARKGFADPQSLPPQVGRQAMARFLKAGEKHYTGGRRVSFPLSLKPWQVASGVMEVRVSHKSRLRIYYRNNDRTVPGARVVEVREPRRDYEVALTPTSHAQYFRIGLPQAGKNPAMNSAYGIVYRFKVNAPAGSKVRISFSPRGGQAGMVGTVDGIVRQSRIVGTAVWSLFSESIVGKDGMMVTTLPFGGVFYPVEVAFHLTK